MILTWPLSGGRASFPVTRSAAEHVQDGERPAVDLACPAGIPTLACHDAMVAVAGDLGTCGLGVYLEWNESGILWRAGYCHHDAIGVATGDYVAAGHPIGMAGSTGMSTGPHLHFFLERGGQRVDPQPLLEAGGQMDEVKLREALDRLWEVKEELERAAALFPALNPRAQKIFMAVVNIKEATGIQ